VILLACRQKCSECGQSACISERHHEFATTHPPAIAALPASTTRQLGSGQVLVDPSSVVKELIDNALDARAKSIFVDVSLNTIDSIQVKDDGHGIASEDRALACRRYCTSKIRDIHDLKEVGGKWLGFRGEALASLAGMSQILLVTTRVEGEPVAVMLKYGKDGELTLCVLEARIERGK
jgi:DNA mismatch repair protein MutL